VRAELHEPLSNACNFEHKLQDLRLAQDHCGRLQQLFIERVNQGAARRELDELQARIGESNLLTLAIIEKLIVTVGGEEQ
jgi:hypothetical protein